VINRVPAGLDPDSFTQLKFTTPNAPEPFVRRPGEFASSRAGLGS